MHLALVDGARTPPSPGLSGVCPACGRDMVAKCGDVRIHHWAHLGRRVCDGWWEPETEWHRTWKNHFDLSWQEVIGHDDASGEKHIADVRTAEGLVIEFQHSYLRAEERRAREAYYGNMVWVVDGTRVPRDYKRFQSRGNAMGSGKRPGEFTVYYPEDCFSENWLGSSVPVFFDFRGTAALHEDDDPRWDVLWCLLPGRAENSYAKAIAMPREDFIAAALTRPAIIDLPPPVESAPVAAKRPSRLDEALALRRAYIRIALQRRRGRRF